MAGVPEETPRLCNANVEQCLVELLGRIEELEEAAGLGHSQLAAEVNGSLKPIVADWLGQQDKRKKMDVC